MTSYILGSYELGIRLAMCYEPVYDIYEGQFNIKGHFCGDLASFGVKAKQ